MNPRTLLAAVLTTAVTSASTTVRAADYGAFLTSQFAARQGRMDFAANQILSALNGDPANLELQKDAFTLSLLAGRPEAVQLAPHLRENPVAMLVLADHSARAGDWVAAELAYAELPHDQLIDALRPLLLAWCQQAQGRTDKALATLAPGMASGTAIGAEGGRFAGFYTMHAALIADMARRDGLANQLYGQVAKNLTAPNVRLAQILASWQARSGQPAQARETLEALAKSSPEMAMALPRLLASMDQPQVATPLEGIAEAYTGMAAALRAETQGELPALVLHLAILLAPQLTEAHLVGAEIASARQDYAGAAAELQQIPADDPLAPVINMHLARYLARAGRHTQAQAMLEHLAQDYPKNPEPQINLGDILIDGKKYAEGITAYSRAIALIKNPGKTDWSLFYARGAAYERAHDLLRAEDDMRQALALFPDQPIALNFLGFSWADQNRNLPQAREMIQRALDQRPNDGAIIDSLGWVVLRQGDVPQAIHLLEKAAELNPVDPTVTGHLGDAYWEAGRKLEAQDQWRRALVLNPDPDEASRIEARLKTSEK